MKTLLSIIAIFLLFSCSVQKQINTTKYLSLNEIKRDFQLTNNPSLQMKIIIPTIEDGVIWAYYTPKEIGFYASIINTAFPVYMELNGVRYSLFWDIFNYGWRMFTDYNLQLSVEYPLKLSYTELV